MGEWESGREREATYIVRNERCTCDLSYCSKGGFSALLSREAQERIELCQVAIITRFWGKG